MDSWRVTMIALGVVQFIVSFIAGMQIHKWIRKWRTCISRETE